MIRRAFIRDTAIAGTTVATSFPLPAAAGSTAEAQDVTPALARYLVTVRFEDPPEAARREAGRSLLNWMAVAVGGWQRETVDIALAAVAPFAGPPQAGVFRRKHRLDIMNAAFLNGISSHVSPDDRARRLMELCRSAERLDDVDDSVRAAAA